MSTTAVNQTQSISHVARISRNTLLCEIFLHRRKLQPTTESLAEPESNIVCVSHPIVVDASRQMIGNFLNCNNGIAGISLGILSREYNKQINMKMRIHSKTTGSKLPPNNACSRRVGTHRPKSRVPANSFFPFRESDSPHSPLTRAVRR
jgi:hypothetical protein